MPKPKGWSDEMLAERDKRVKGMLEDKDFHGREGVDRESRAHAIATAAVERERKSSAG